MAVQEEQRVDPTVQILFQSLREDMDKKFADLGKQVAVISEYVIEAKTLEKARDLMTEIKGLATELRAQDKRLVALEEHRSLPAQLEKLKQSVEGAEKREAEYQGQIKMLKWISGAFGFLLTLLGILQLFRLIPAK